MKKISKKVEAKPRPKLKPSSQDRPKKKKKSS